MAKTVEGALNMLLRDAGLVGGRCWPVHAVPAGATLPYLTYAGPQAVTPRLRGDGGFTMTVERLVTVDLWQNTKRPDGNGMAEDPTLPGRLFDALDGAGLDVDTSSGKVYRCHAQDLQRVEEPDENNLTHHAVTLSIKHDRGLI